MVDSKIRYFLKGDSGKGASVMNSIIRACCNNRKNSEIKNSFIGSFTSIGSEVTVTDSLSSTL